eukprot:TRINITY_DN203_c0_g1_i3.p2 TRINITY_DN203_c0_g1~~TRINITY_DN203_c0_g1_i3.p2  ORF type:complete len:436 (-),score=108.89 TRINITY_DN203_c0_g1_i3:37-1344(-)
MWDAEGKFYPSTAGTPLLAREGGSFRGVAREGRKFNDVLFGILFVLMVAGMAAIGVIAGIRGNPEMLIQSSEWTEDASVRAEHWFQDSVAHLRQSYDIVLCAGLGLSIVLGIVWLQLLRMFTKFFIYMTLILGVLSIIALGGYSLHMGIKNGQSGFKTFSYITFGVAFLLVLAIFFLRKKIDLTAGLFKESCKGIQHNFFGLFGTTTIVFGLVVLLFLAWMFTLINLFSIPGKNIDIHIDNVPQFNTSIRNLMYYQLFGLFWTVSFLLYLLQFSTSGAIASWYFSRVDKQSMKGSPAFLSLGHGLSKSFGSIAFGSLVTAIVAFLNFLMAKLEKTTFNNRVVKFATCFVKCCLACITKMVQFINRYAFIHMAMHGGSFCTSARNCFDLISRNMFTAVVVDMLGDLVLYVGRFFCSAICTIFAMAVSYTHLTLPTT